MRIQIFFLVKGLGVPNDYCICRWGGGVRGIFLVILLCEIIIIEISRGGGGGFWTPLHHQNPCMKKEFECRIMKFNVTVFEPRY